MLLYKTTMLLRIVVTAICCCSLFTSDTRGTILTKPQNTAAATGEKVFFNCSSDTSYPSWRYNNLDIVTPNCVVDPTNAADYATETATLNTCNLIVLNASLSVAGNYSCFDTDVNAESFLVLTVLGSVATAVSNQSEVVEGDELLLTCTVVFNSSIVTPMVPVLRWISPTLDDITNATVTTGLWSTTSEINIVAVRPDVLPYTCSIQFEPPVNPPSNMAGNVPNNEYTITTYPIYGVYYPVDPIIIQVDKSCSDGSLIFTCQASSMPAAWYEWHSLSGDLVQGSVLHRTIDGQAKCTASNVIRGKTYSTSASVSYQSNCGMTDAEIAAITLGTLLGVVLVAGAATLIYILLKENQVDHSDSIPNLQNRTSHPPRRVSKVYTAPDSSRSNGTDHSDSSPNLQHGTSHPPRTVDNVYTRQDSLRSYGTDED